MYGLPYKLVGQALAYAVTAHHGQFRKNGITPYIVHPIGVADIVYETGGDENQILTALFHDIVEDCLEEGEDKAMRANKIACDWNATVASMVVDLTNTSKDDAPHLNRAQRKQADAKRLANIHLKSQLVKLADILYNVNDLDSFTVGFARKFLAEKLNQVEVMTADWDMNDDNITYGHVNLRRRCREAIVAQLEKLNNV